MTESDHITLDIVLPVFNPPPGWDVEIIRHYKSFRSGLPSNVLTRLILVDDGNPRDITGGKERVRSVIAESTWISYPTNRGKGHALRKGVELAGGMYILYTDHDLPYSTESMLAMAHTLFSGDTDLVIGVRDSRYYAHISPFRKWISSFMRTLNRKWIKLPTEDTQCGLKAFNRKGRACFLSTRTDRYLVDLEFLALAAGKGLQSSLQTVTLREGIKLSPIKNLRLIRELITYIRIALNSY